MDFKGFSIDKNTIKVRLGNIILCFETVEELEKLAEDLRLSVEEIREG